MANAILREAAAPPLITMTRNLISRSALVVGATAGIGEAIAVKLASQGASVTIAGRSADAGARVVERMHSAFAAAEEAKDLATPTFEFLRLDASTLAATRAFSTAFAAAHADTPLHYLVMCQATASFGGRRKTEEGFELKLVLHAYTRFLLTHDLLPLLRLGTDNDESAGGRVLSVLSGGVHGPFTDWADADLKSSFSLKRAADAAGFYNDLAFQRMADEPANRSLGFLHAAPGFVASTWGHRTKAAFVIKLMQKLFAKSSEDCAKIMVEALCDPRYATGFHPVNDRGEPAKTTDVHTPDNLDAMQTHLRAVYTRALGSAAPKGLE